MASELVLCIGSAVDIMDNYVEREIDYWDPVGKGDKCLSTVLSDIRTVGDIKRLPPERITGMLWAIADNCCMYRNHFNVMSDEQLQQLFGLVLDSYEDDKHAEVIYVHR